MAKRSYGMTGLCQDCKYFDDDGRSMAGRGRCARWRTGYHIDPDNLRDNEVIVESYEGWVMSVGPEFGCVLWERGDNQHG